MSLPLQSTGAIIGAAVLATKAVQQIGEVLSFDEVLNSPAVSQLTDNVVSDPKAILEKLTQAISDRLAEFGLGANPPNQISVLANGTIQVNENHENAAKIEATLANDPAIASIVNELRSSSLPGPWSVDLTRTATQGNIP
ncbi:hypothetical protein [Rubripirellula reticaptiva]|uniref:Uncharacterized protein n=1 Tax=Rubripirellula reticaptiva TaxID=2528013 RepID=A0A5C6F8H3_9BACT|nr:hypothetical protein [Rubripirellula reticaptiva]TWU55821.1 hypothetical protein Poly59_21230 [Rubripirellula reticaptiva]